MIAEDKDDQLASEELDQEFGYDNDARQKSFHSTRD